MDLAPHRATLHHLSRTDPDPRVRHRADGLVLVANGLSLAETARRFGGSPRSLRRWGERFLTEGRDGLADRARQGRPPKLDAAARDLLEAALTQSPLEHGYPVTIWTAADDRNRSTSTSFPTAAYRLFASASEQAFARPRRSFT